MSSYLIHKLEKADLGLKINVMNKSHIRFEIFKNMPFDMCFYVDLTLRDVEIIQTALKAASKELLMDL